jgi:hypothetical protein
VTDWRYWVTYEGTVSAPREDDAIQAALDDVDNGKIPIVEVEEIEE